MLTLLVSSIIVTVGLGTLFSFVYPRVELDLSLASLFAFAGLLLSLAVRGAWRAIRHKTM
jgi:hypothetical protein